LALTVASCLQPAFAASLTPLPLPATFIGGAALDISQDGRVIVGWAVTASGQEDAVRWDLGSTGYQATNLRPLIENSLPTTPINYTYNGSRANAVAVSGNSVVIGGSFRGSPFGPPLGFRIGPNGTDYFGTSENYARGVNAFSADGSVVAGTGEFPVFSGGQFVGGSGPRAFVNDSVNGPRDFFGNTVSFWPLDGGFFPPGPLGLNPQQSFGTDLSADGTRLVGTTSELLPGVGFEQRVFVTDLGTTFTRLLGRIPDSVVGGPGQFLDNNSVTAAAISADGTRVVGAFEQLANGLPLGVVYAENTNGDFAVERLLRPAPVQSGTNAFESSEAVDISDDNRLIVGNGTASSPGGTFLDDLFNATLWVNSPASGVQPAGTLLLDVLRDSGVDVSRWQGDFQAAAVSGNGRYVIGQGAYDLGGGNLQVTPWVADLNGTGFWTPPPPGFGDTFFFVPDPGGTNRLDLTDRWQDGFGQPANLVPGPAQAAVFNSPNTYFVELIAGPDFSVDTLTVLDGKVTFLTAGSLPLPLIDATRQVTVDLSQSQAVDPRVAFQRIALRAPLLEVLSAGSNSGGDVGVRFVGGSLDVTQLMSIGSAGTSAWLGNTADVDRLDLAGYLLVAEEFVGLPGTPEIAASARFGKVTVASGGWFNQSRSLLPGGSVPLANASTVTIDRTLDVAAGGRYELVDGRLEVSGGNPANGQPDLRVGGTFAQEGGEVHVVGDAEVTGLFSAQGWDRSFVNANAREAPVIDIGGKLTVAGNGSFRVSSSGVPGGHVRLGTLQLGGLGTPLGGEFSASSGVDVEVAGEVTVGAGAQMSTSNLSATRVHNAGSFVYDHIHLAGGDFINSGFLFSSGDPSALAPQTSIDGRLKNTRFVYMNNGLNNAVTAGIDNRGGVLRLGSQPTSSTRLITPTLYNSGLLESYTGRNFIQGPADPFGSPTLAQVENDGIMRVVAGELGIDGSFTQTGGSTVVNGLLRAGSVEFLAGTVGGSGTIEYTGSLNSAVTFGAGLTVQPGNSPGILTINGNLAVAGAIFDIEVGGLEPGTLFDQLIVNGDANFIDATINFRFIDGFLPTPGDTFDWLVVSGFATGLDTLTVSLFSDLGSVVGFLDGNGRLFVDVVTPVPLPPAAWALGSAVLAMGAVGRRRRRPAVAGFAGADRG
jgi:hypothetical protein